MLTASIQASFKEISISAHGENKVIALINLAAHWHEYAAAQRDIDPL